MRRLPLLSVSLSILLGAFFLPAASKAYPLVDCSQICPAHGGAEGTLYCLDDCTGLKVHCSQSCIYAQ
jgi:hypothetical protein